MPPQPKRVCELETVWIREFARTYLPSEAGFTCAPERLRQAGLTLIGVKNVFRRGHVVFADKLDEPGALWIIEGNDNDGVRFRITVKVETERQAVDLQKVEKMPANDQVEEKSDGYGAA